MGTANEEAAKSRGAEPGRAGELQGLPGAPPSTSPRERKSTSGRNLRKKGREQRAACPRSLVRTHPWNLVTRGHAGFGDRWGQKPSPIRYRRAREVMGTQGVQTSLLKASDLGTPVPVTLSLHELTSRFSFSKMCPKATKHKKLVF